MTQIRIGIEEERQYGGMQGQREKLNLYKTIVFKTAVTLQQAYLISHSCLLRYVLRGIASDGDEH
jgi:hypothetical protein